MSLFVGSLQLLLLNLRCFSSIFFSLLLHSFMPLTYLPFSVDFVLICILTHSDRALKSFYWFFFLGSTRFHDSSLIHDFFLVRGLPRTVSTTLVCAFLITWKSRSNFSSSIASSSFPSTLDLFLCLQDVSIFQLSRILLNSNSFLSLWSVPQKLWWLLMSAVLLLLYILESFREFWLYLIPGDTHIT